MFRYYVELVTDTTGYVTRTAGVDAPKSFYLYAWSAEQVRDQLRDYEIIAIDQTD